MTPRINPADPSERKWLRDWLTQSGSVAGLNLEPIAADLRCKPTVDSIVATLDLLDERAEADASADEWFERHEAELEARDEEAS